jgi:transcriptional regulator with XRE-family HTH domain
MEILGKRIKYEREFRKRKDPKWTQEYLADLLGVARPTYTAYEKGTKQPSLETINKIADVFDVSTDYLAGRTDDRTPKKLNEKTPEEEFDDPELNIFFKEVKEDSPERQEQLMKIWKIIKSEGKKEK